MVELTAMVHEEARAAGELIGLARQHPDREALVRQVGAGQLEALGELGPVCKECA